MPNIVFKKILTENNSRGNSRHGCSHIHLGALRLLSRDLQQVVAVVVQLIRQEVAGGQLGDGRRCAGLRYPIQAGPVNTIFLHHLACLVIQVAIIVLQMAAPSLGLQIRDSTAKGGHDNAEMMKA